MLIRLKRTLGFFLRRLQGISLYKSLARALALNDGRIDIRTQEESRRQSSTIVTFVAQKNNTVVGTVRLVKSPAQNPYAGYWLCGLSIKFFYRRLGIGEKLTRAVIARAQQEGAQELFLLVAEDNLQAIKLYLKLGFGLRMVPSLEEKLKKEKALRGYRRVVMSKDLKERMPSKNIVARDIRGVKDGT